MTKEELQRLVDGLPEDAGREELDRVEDLIDESVEMQELLLMRAAFRLRDVCARRHRNETFRIIPDEEELT